MAATIYDDQRTYIKFLTDKCKEEQGGRDECRDECDSNECSCCPPGLVAVYNDNDEHIGCLSPNDAELFQKNTYTCKDGYVKLTKSSDGTFFGCVSEGEFATLYPIINP